MKRTLLPFYMSMIIAVGCGTPAKPTKASNEDLLNTYLSVHAPTVHLAVLKGVVHVTEIGCIACNRTFATLVSEHANDSTLLFIVSAIGQQVDVTAFKKAGARVIWDYDEEFKKAGVLDKSGFIKLSHGRIDTIVRINAALIESQLALIAQLTSGGNTSVP